MEHPSDSNMILTEELVSWKIYEIDNRSYSEINICLRKAVIPKKEHISEFNENYTKSPPKANVSQCVKSIKEKIIRFRRTLGHLTNIIN